MYIYIHTYVCIYIYQHTATLHRDGTSYIPASQLVRPGDRPSQGCGMGQAVGKALRFRIYGSENLWNIYG